MIDPIRVTQRARPVRTQEAPYRNLILAGDMGVGKRALAEAVAAHFNAPLRDIEAEIEAEAGMPPQEVRALFGEARLTNLETECCRELALQRGAVVSVSASAMLNEANRRRLQETGVVLVLTIAVNEALRRLHAERGAAFRDPRQRGLEIARLKREWQVRALPGFAQLDTTRLSFEEVATQVIAYWGASSEI